MTPHPRLTRNTWVRKIWIGLLSAIGVALSLALFFAALVPSPGNAVRPAGGVIACLGIIISLWIGWYAISIPRYEAPVPAPSESGWPTVATKHGYIEDSSQEDR